MHINKEHLNLTSKAKQIKNMLNKKIGHKIEKKGNKKKIHAQFECFTFK